MRRTDKRVYRSESMLSLAIALAAMGCGAPPDVEGVGPDPAGVSSTEGAIVNGTSVTTDHVGTPSLVNTPINDQCSSTLMRDRWLITAYHCVTLNGGTRDIPTAPGNLSAKVGNVTVAGSEIFFSGQTATPTFDVALVKLAGSLPAPSGHAEPWETPLYAGTTASLVGNRYTCQGWGYSSCSTQDVALRSATLKISSQQNTDFTILPNLLGQIPTLGDSGSGCYQLSSGRYYVLGIDSNGECGVDAHYTGAETMRDWVDSVIDRVGVLDQANGAMKVKEGGLGHAWVSQESGVFLASIAGPRVAKIRASDQHCFVKEGDFSNAWVDQWSSGGVVRCLLDGSRIGILTQDGTFRVKDGSVSSSGWVTQSSTVASAVLSGSRIGVVSFADGHFYAKEGALNAAWVDQYANAQQGMLSGTRVGVITTDGVFRVKDGTLSSSGWVQQATSTSQGTLSGNRIGRISSTGAFYVKEGGLSASFTFLFPGVVQAALSGKRIAVVVNEGTASSPYYRFRVKEGAVGASWVVQEEGSTAGYLPVVPSK